MRADTLEALLARLDRFDPLVEVGVGRRPQVANALAARGHTVTATDLRDRQVSPAVAFVCDDVTDPTRSVYADAAALYALSLPPELHRPVYDLARSVGATFLFTTLGGDPPAVPVERETLPGATLFTAKPEPP